MNTNTRYAQTLNAVVGANKVAFVEVGYGQVEPNHLSAQRTGQIYAQLPAAEDIPVLQQGQFVKYDYANEVCNFTGPGEWMLVYNETKLYREGQNDCEFALIKTDYNARIYSPYGEDKTEGRRLQSRYYNGYDERGPVEGTTITVKPATYKAVDTTTDTFDEDTTYYSDNEGTVDDTVTALNFAEKTGLYVLDTPATTYTYDKVTSGTEDIYEMFQTEDPFHILPGYKEKKMPEGTKMVPRVFKTNIGDIFTTNTVDEDLTSADVGEILYIGDKGILTKTEKTTADENGAISGGMQWQIVKFYTMPDGQKGVKLMRIA